MLLVRDQGSPEGFFLQELFEPLGETVWLDVSKGRYELFHRTFCNHALDVGVSSEQVLEV